MNKPFKLAVSWEMSGYVEVYGESLEDAMDKFNENPNLIKLPTDGEYVDGSFSLSTNDPEEMEEIVT